MRRNWTGTYQKDKREKSPYPEPASLSDFHITPKTCRMQGASRFLVWLIMLNWLDQNKVWFSTGKKFLGGGKTIGHCFFSNRQLFLLFFLLLFVENFKRRQSRLGGGSPTLTPL